ncbi:MAG: hypothetical protein M0Z27_01610, partial [Thermaerobacter sp.]|nr:hypothetical protein [Thermaerobacter sp.]
SGSCGGANMLPGRQGLLLLPQLRRGSLPRYAMNRRDFSLLYRWMRRRERPFREGLRLPRRGAAASRAAGRVVGSWEGRP